MATEDSVAAVPALSSARRITIVADEMLGYVRTGGLGTATSFLALALARMGHQVDFLYIGDEPAEPIGAEWSRLYEDAGVVVRTLPRSGDKIEPSYFARAHDTELALRAGPPDIVITQDLAAPAYTAMRLRQLGLDFERTAFVVYCHGTRQWITDMARKARVLPGALGIGVLERASVELADAVVSPSAYLIEWMRRQGWRLPERSLVIPYLTRSTATGERRPRTDAAGQPVSRLVFFGRLEERKGLRPFAAGLNSLDRDLLAKVELEFLGMPTPSWPPKRVEQLLSTQTKQSVRRISFATDLSQEQALARLAQPGTVAVMPSLEDNSPATVYECLELGIPFVTSGAGGGGELVAPADRDRVLFEPSRDGIASALQRVLSSSNGFEPAHAAFEPDEPYRRWCDVVESPILPRVHAAEQRNADVVTEHITATDLGEGPSEWVVVLDESDLPADDLLPTLIHAQQASGADVVTCGVRLDSGAVHFFLGEPGALGLVSNSYGTIALIRRSLLASHTSSTTAAGDLSWPLLAGLSLEGADIVSIPRALAKQRREPGSARRQLSDALVVAQHFEKYLQRPLRPLARLAVGLASSPEVPSPAAGLLRAARTRLSEMLSRR